MILMPCPLFTSTIHTYMRAHDTGSSMIVGWPDAAFGKVRHLPRSATLAALNLKDPHEVARMEVLVNETLKLHTRSQVPATFLLSLILQLSLVQSLLLTVTRKSLSVSLHLPSWTTCTCTASFPRWTSTCLHSSLLCYDAHVLPRAHAHRRRRWFLH